MLKSSNEITPEILAGIEGMAKCFFVPKEIALALEIEDLLFLTELKDESSAIYRAFNKGWLQSEYEQRKCIFQLALSGSSPAQTMVEKIRDKATMKLLDQ